MSLSTILPPLPRNPFAVVWTRRDCEKLVAAGALDFRYELVEGEIINKMGQNLPHRISIIRIIEWLCQIFSSDYVQTQAKIDVLPEDNPTSEPEPDAAVLTASLPQLAQQDPTQNPRPEQVRLLIEVADTTLNYDLIVKAGLYARANIAEYWVLDLNARQLHVLRKPANGAYQQVNTHPETASVASLAAPDAAVIISRLLP